MQLQPTPAAHLPECRLPSWRVQRASNDPLIKSARIGRRPQTRHALAVVVTDFLATSEAFHRALIRIARRAAPRIGLLHRPGADASADSGTDLCCDEILLEGLRCRLGLDEAGCAIFTSAPTLRGLGDILFIHGRMAGDHPPSGLHPISLAPRLRSDLLIVEDGPDWDRDNWGETEE